MTVKDSHKAELVPIDSLQPYKGNPRRGDVAVIQESLRANGQYRPIVVRRETKEILAGNHTWMAARAEGWDKIWVTWVSCDDDTARRINLVDNRAPELGDYDAEALAAMLQASPDLTGTGWTDTDLQGILDQLGEAEPLEYEEPESTHEVSHGVILMCDTEAQQSRVYGALHRAQQGDVADLQKIIKDVVIDTVQA